MSAGSLDWQFVLPQRRLQRVCEGAVRAVKGASIQTEVFRSLGPRPGIVQVLPLAEPFKHLHQKCDSGHCDVIPEPVRSHMQQEMPPRTKDTEDTVHKIGVAVTR